MERKEKKMTQSAEQYEWRKYRRFSLYCRISGGASVVAAIAVAFIAPLLVAGVLSVAVVAYLGFLEWSLFQERSGLRRRYGNIPTLPKSAAEKFLRRQRLSLRFSLGTVILLAVAYTVNDLTAQPFLGRYWIAATISVAVAILASILLTLVETYYAKRIRRFGL